MTQSGSARTVFNSTVENYESLKKYAKFAGNNRKEYIRNIQQVTTASAVNLEEVSGETIAAMSANKTLNVWQKTDNVGTDGGATGTVEWMSATGVLTSATFTLDASDTTTHAALVSAVTTARHIRSFEMDSMDATDEVLLGNVAGDEIFAVIKAGHHQCLKSKFMGALSRRTFIGRIRATLSLLTANCVLVMTYTPLNETLPVTKRFELKPHLQNVFEPCIEIAAASEVSFTIIDDDVAHPTADVEITYLEVW